MLNHTQDAGSYCALRWKMMQIDLQHGKVKACCKTPFVDITEEDIARLGKDCLFNHPYFIHRRREMLEGVFHSDCSGCWELEAANALSYRQTESLKPIFMDARDEELGRRSLRDTTPLHLEIITGTTCDLRCVYCGPEFSSAWWRETRRRGALPHALPPGGLGPAPSGFSDLFESWLEAALPSLRYVQFNGGEPLLDRQMFRLLDLLVRSPAARADLQLGIVSNLNAPPAVLRDFIDCLRTLPSGRRLRLGISIDAVGRKAEYIRYGLSWAKFEANVHLLMESGLAIDYQFAPTMSVLNVAPVVELIHWVAELSRAYDVPVGWRPGVVTAPAHLSPLILPAGAGMHLLHAEELLAAQARWSNLAEYLRQLRRGFEKAEDIGARRRAFAEWVDANDRRRGTSLADTLPELARFLQDCRRQS